jgi:hypothetical protein
VHGQRMITRLRNGFAILSCEVISLCGWRSD